MRPKKTIKQKVADLKRSWYVIDAEGLDKGTIAAIQNVGYENKNLGGVLNPVSLTTIKEKIEKEHLRESQLNVKLCVGGIREFEFFVQIFQLLYGGIRSE